MSLERASVGERAGASRGAPSPPPPRPCPRLHVVPAREPAPQPLEEADGNDGEPAVDANGAADDGGKSAKSAQVDEVASALDAVDISEKVAANGHGVLSAADGDEDDATALEKDVGADEDTKRAAPAAPPMSGIEKARDAKARKKEEKRARKEQRHREAVAAAQGAVEDESADGENTASERTSSSNSIITL